MFIDMRQIAVQLGDRVVFDHSDWQMRKGQHWAVIGANGSGKTVLANAILHKLPLVQGQVLYHFADEQLQQGRSYLYPGEVLIFSADTHRAFYQKFSGYHQARWQSFESEDAPSVADLLEGQSIFQKTPYEVSASYDRNDFEQRRDFLIDLFQLKPLLGRKIHQLSHGESRKVFLTRLLLRSPKLLIIDDPFTGLDEASRRKLRSAINVLLLNQDPPILIIVSRTSDLPEAVTHLLYVKDMKIAGQGEQNGFSEQLRAQINQDCGDDGPGPVNRQKLHRSTGTLSDRQPMLRMQKVSVMYGDVQILRDIDWLVRQGERWALQGPNGAGKSTLLSLILGDHPQAYSRSIEVFGQRRGSGESIWEIKAKIGWVSPELHVFYKQQASCLDVVSSGFFDSVGLYHKVSPDQKHTAVSWLNALDMAGLDDIEFSRLSTGQQRLALLARALVKTPPLLILDEPCQGLDMAHRNHFIAMVDRICAQSPVTLIYVTHDNNELPESVTHRLLLNQGLIEYSGLI